MKNLSSIFVFLLLSYFSFSQNVNIPDPDFLQALIDRGVDTNGDGQIQESEAKNTTSLYFYYASFASMEGINAFTNLQTLKCSYNNLIHKIELTGLNNLEYLNFYSNNSLDTIILDGATELNFSVSNNNSLVDLEFIGSISFKDLKIYSNNSLKNLDFSNIQDVKSLRLESNNSISNYDFSGLESLLSLNLISNNSLKSINLSPITSLTDLSVSSNPALSEIVFGQNSNIKECTLYNNPSMQAIDLSNLSNLTNLILRKNNVIASIDFTGLNSLTSLSVEESPSIVSLDFSVLPNLAYLTIKRNNSLKDIILGNSGTISNLTVSYDNSLPSIDLSGLNQLKNLQINDCGLIKSLDIIDLNNLESVKLFSNNSIENIELKNLNALSSLAIDYNSSLKNILYNNLNSLKTIYLSDNASLQKFDLIDLISLNSFNCSRNNEIKGVKFKNLPQITRLDFSNNTSLTSIDIQGFPTLENLNLERHPNLNSVICKNLNSLKSINIYASSKIENMELDSLNSLNTLSFDNIGFNKLEINGFPSLSRLNIQNMDNLDTIIVSNLNSLNYLYVYNCDNLTKLDLNTLNSLDDINIQGNNALQELDLSGLPSLNSIYLYSNRIRYLNVMGVPIFANLRIYYENNIEWICAEPKQLEWLENAIDLTGIILDPICNFTGRGDFKTVELAMKYSASGDCEEATQVINKTRLRVNSEDLNVLIEPTLNESNKFEIKLPPGNYQITPEQDNIGYFEVTPKPLNLTIKSTDKTAYGSFCYTSAADSIYDCSVHVIPMDLARPGFKIVHKIVITNNGNYPASGRIGYAYQSDYMSFVSSNYSLVDSSGTLHGVYDNIEPFQSIEISVIFRLNSPMDTPALVGDEELYFVAALYSEVIDKDGRDNRFVLYEKVRNAFDPNDKTCLQGDYLLDEMIGEYISYKIRFKNTGNASAVNVRVIDEINPEYFDISTLSVVESSHPVYTEIIDDEVAFLFDGINLPYIDSLSDGFVIFEIRTRDSIDLETKLENTAEIYFDFNYPVVTNTATTQVVTDADDDGYNNLSDCDDHNPDVNPGAVEIIYNGLDDDCNPNTLDDDLDQDGYALAEDCDDNNPDINPGQDEVSYNGIDDDCDPNTLDDDLDQDGYVLAEDCDDDNPDINPGKDEVPYNGIDDDCDSSTLDDDLDQDGFVLAEDCDDDNPEINPNQTEIPYNGQDDDCNPVTLDDDLDQDGFVLTDDCDDTNPNINPDAHDIPNNGIDEDCDGEDAVTSTGDLADPIKRIYPNPVSDEINIEFSKEIAYSSSLINLNGEIVKTVMNKRTIDVSTLSQDMYILEVKNLKTYRKFIYKIVIINKGRVNVLGL